MRVLLLVLLGILPLLSLCEGVSGSDDGECACGYMTDNGALWTNQMILDFSTAADAHALMLQHFSVSNYAEVAGHKVPMQYTTNNVYNANSGLALKVSAYKGSGYVQTAEIASIQKFLYGSFRMRSVIPSASGVCFSSFLYRDDSHEVDIEFLTKDTNYYDHAYYTNQPCKQEGSSACVVDTYGPDYTAAHWHRIDWIPSSTQFFVDDVLRSTLTANVPQVSMSWIINDWSDGGVWTAGPPTQDAPVTVFALQAYYNNTATLSHAQFNAQCSKAGNVPPCRV